MKYVLAPQFRTDLREIGLWIARENPERAENVILLIRDRVRAAASHPLHYQLRPEIGVGARLIQAGTYVVLYWITERAVRFERVIHGSRDLPAMYRRTT